MIASASHHVGINCRGRLASAAEPSGPQRPPAPTAGRGSEAGELVGPDGPARGPRLRVRPVRKPASERHVGISAAAAASAVCLRTSTGRGSCQCHGRSTEAARPRHAGGPDWAPGPAQVASATEWAAAASGAGAGVRVRRARPWPTPIWNLGSLLYSTVTFFGCIISVPPWLNSTSRAKLLYSKGANPFCAI